MFSRAPVPEDYINFRPAPRTEAPRGTVTMDDLEDELRYLYEHAEMTAEKAWQEELRKWR